jgi:hypothetical protein
MSVFETARNNIVTVTRPTWFLLRQRQKHNAIKDLDRNASVTKTPTTERRSRLLRGSFVTVTFPREPSVTPPVFLAHGAAGVIRPTARFRSLGAKVGPRIKKDRWVRRLEMLLLPIDMHRAKEGRNRQPCAIIQISA